jgi:hypothetical protein
MLWGIAFFALSVLAAAKRHQQFTYLDFDLLAPVRGIPWLCGRANLWRLHQQRRGLFTPGEDWAAKRRGDAVGLALVLAGMALAQWPILHPAAALVGIGGMIGLVLVAEGDSPVSRAVAFLREFATLGRDPSRARAVAPRRMIVLGLQAGLAAGLFAVLVGWRPGGWGSLLELQVLAACLAIGVHLWWRPADRRALVATAPGHLRAAPVLAGARNAARISFAWAGVGVWLATVLALFWLYTT